MKRAFFSLAILCLVILPWAHADQPIKPAVVPTDVQWVHALDTDDYLQLENSHKNSAVEHFHLRLRYLDPDVNAFVGMQTDLDHFSRDLVLGANDTANNGNFLWDMGAHIGLVRKKATWELDLMGVTAAGKLGPALAVIYEHRYNAHWMYYNRTQGDIFVGDGIFDFDQAVAWDVEKSWDVTGGYRIFTSLHSNHNGPHLGIRYSFDSLKIPFIFPSLG
jgi:hypothetical protein